MEFWKLLPTEGGDGLAAAHEIRGMKDDVAVVDAAPDAGQDHVGGMIAVTVWFPVLDRELAPLTFG